MLVEIKNRWSGAVLWSGEVADVKEAMLKALATKTDLTDADLRDADLTPIRDDLWAVLSSAFAPPSPKAGSTGRPMTAPAPALSGRWLMCVASATEKSPA